MDESALDEALARIAGSAPETTQGFSNHAPMAAEALVRMDRAEAVGDFIERYRRTLTPGPGPGKAVGDDEWEAALGRTDRYGDWVALFDRALAERSVDEVAADWVPRLAPGSIAAATHGLIRTAHALRSLRHVDNDARRHELAEGLAYWAARYQELPGPPVLIGANRVEQALAILPHLPDDAPDEVMISDQVRHVELVADHFETAVVSLAPPIDLDAALAAVAVGGATAYMDNAPRGHEIGLIHAVTGPMALELVLPALREEDRPTVFAYGWQAVAALHVAYAIDRQASDVADVPYPEELAAGAVASGDEHAIKLAEACLRAYQHTGEPVLLAAATDAADRLRRS